MMLLQRERRRARRAFFPGALCATLLVAGSGGGESDGTRSGACWDTEAAPDEAVREIDRDLTDHQGYPAGGP